MGRSAHLLDQMQMMSIGSDVITLQLLRLRGLAPVRRGKGREGGMTLLHVFRITVSL